MKQRKEMDVFSHVYIFSCVEQSCLQQAYIKYGKIPLSHNSIIPRNNVYYALFYNEHNFHYTHTIILKYAYKQFSEVVVRWEWEKKNLGSSLVSNRAKKIIWVEISIALKRRVGTTFSPIFQRPEFPLLVLRDTRYTLS